MKKTLLVSALFVASVAVPSVAVSADTTVTIENTGPKSENKVKIGKKGRRGDSCNRRRSCGGCSSRRVRRSCSGVQNNNNLNANVETVQTAKTGNAKVKKNTEAGDAETGDADNVNGLMADVKVENDNSGAGGCGCDDGGDTDVVIENTGPRSRNVVRVGRSGNGGRSVQNNNNVNIDNYTDQYARSGNAVVKHNTEGGDATTGDATNENETDVNVDIHNDNSGHGDSCGCGGDTDVYIGTTGPGSRNKVRVGGNGGGGTHVQNNNNLNVSNTTVQTAKTGNATVKGNTHGGDATTGDASNSNHTSVDFSVANNN